MSSAVTLPSGRRGQALALGMLLLAAAAAWSGIGLPLLDNFQDRADRLRRQEALIRRMEARVATLPGLRDQAGRVATSVRPSSAVLPGASDSLAAAALQQALDEQATAAGVRIASQEILPTRAVGAFRAIAVRVTATAPYTSLVALLLALARAEMPMIADDIALRGPAANGRDAGLPVTATFTVTAYRAAMPEAGGKP
nr:type II secretion system protein GspM [uncultured Rhodopila sp.]